MKENFVKEGDQVILSVSVIFSTNLKEDFFKKHSLENSFKEETLENQKVGSVEVKAQDEGGVSGHSIANYSTIYHWHVDSSTVHLSVFFVFVDGFIDGIKGYYF